MMLTSIFLFETLLWASLSSNTVDANNQSVAIEQVAESCVPCGNPDWTKVFGVCAHWMTERNNYNVFFQQHGGDFKQCACCGGLWDNYGAWDDKTWGHHGMTPEIKCFYRKSESSKVKVDAWY